MLYAATALPGLVEYCVAQQRYSAVLRSIAQQGLGAAQRGNGEATPCATRHRHCTARQRHAEQRHSLARPCDATALLSTAMQRHSNRRSPVSPNGAGDHTPQEAERKGANPALWRVKILPVAQI